MNNITTYYAARKNPFLWLAALLSLVSAAARIVFACQVGGIGVMAVVVRVILPVAANLFIAFRLPLRGEKQFYVTIGPVTVLTAYMFYEGHEVSFSSAYGPTISRCLFQTQRFWPAASACSFA